MCAEGQRTPAQDVESLFLLSGGRFSRGMERLKLARGLRLDAWRLAGLLAALTWLPLLVLTAIDGVAWGGLVQVPFVKDFLPYGQLLLTIPILILGELPVGWRLGEAMAHLRRSEIVDPGNVSVLDDLLTRTVELWRGRSVTGTLFVLTCVATVVSIFGADDWLTGGWQVAGESITPAGWWYLLISLPVMRFLALRWLWRMVLWAWVLWKISRLDLHPRPAHPDRAGGLAFLGATQAAFGVLVFAFGTQLSCLVADAIRYRGAEIVAFRGEMVAFAVIMVAILLLPLLVFAPMLVRVRAVHLLTLSDDAHRGAGDLDRKFRASEHGEMPANAVSGLADFGALYENARLMRPLPVDLRHIFLMVLAAVSPFLPLIFLVIPAQQLLRTLGKLLI